MLHWMPRGAPVRSLRFVEFSIGIGDMAGSPWPSVYLTTALPRVCSGTVVAAVIA